MTEKVRAAQENVSELVGEVRTAAKGQNNLADVVQQVASQVRKDTLSDAVTQDEYTHDVTIKFDGNTYLVYDLTRLGAMKGVSVWDHKPIADEILTDRLSEGWKPTASSLNEGDVILGHAACVLEEHNEQRRDT